MKDLGKGIPTSLLKAAKGSDAAQFSKNEKQLFLLDDIGRKSDCENRTTMNKTRSQQFKLSEAGT